MTDQAKKRAYCERAIAHKSMGVCMLLNGPICEYCHVGCRDCACPNQRVSNRLAAIRAAELEDTRADRHHAIVCLVLESLLERTSQPINPAKIPATYSEAARKEADRLYPPPAPVGWTTASHQATQGMSYRALAPCAECGAQLCSPSGLIVHNRGCLMRSF